MFSYLRDPIWQFIGAILALITLGVSIFVIIAQKNRKSLSCRLLADTELFIPVNGKFRTTYEGHPVQNVFLIIIKVLNDGNVPIEASDFAQELTFAVGPGAHILSAELIHASPENLKPTFRSTQSSVTVQPLLLNSKDEFDVKILCDGYKGGIDIETRIVGVREVKFFKSSTQKDDVSTFFKRTLLDQLLSTFTTLFTFLIIGLSIYSIDQISTSRVIFVMILIVCLSVFFIIKDNVLRR